MKNLLPISLILCLLYLGGNAGRIQAQTPLSVSAAHGSETVPGVLYIQLKAKHGIDFDNISPAHTGNGELDRLFSRIGVTAIYPFDADAKNYAVARRHGIDRMYVINYSGEGFSPDVIGHDFLKLDVIEKVTPRYIFKECYIPNDPHVSEQYALDNMHVKEAWSISKGSSNIVIADVDEGVNYNHEDLAGNIFKVDGHIGYDVVGAGTPGHFKPDYDPKPGPGQSHGMMTTGCFGMIPDNNKGGAGTGFNCKIMIVKIANDSDGQLYGGYEGIQYAVTHGAKIINCSWGGYTTDAAYLSYVQTFIDEALDTGALVVAAAGNDKKDIDADSNFFNPANLNGVFAIGATDKNDNPASFSNYGHAVKVYAPGEGIFSADLPDNNSYTSVGSGTSAATPLTSGVVGLVWAKYPDWTPKFVMRQIIEAADNVVKPSNRAQYWGRVNALSALSQPKVPGLKITDFAIDGVAKGGLNYLNKVYTIDVTFKNYMGAGTGIQAKLIQTPGTADNTFPLYTVQQAVAPLGSMSPLQSTAGSFKFTRDTNDEGKGSVFPMAFAISYGPSTVEGQKYYDTLFLNVEITGDDLYPPKSVAREHSNILMLGNTYPNPVSGEGTIAFELAQAGYARLSISDVLGRTTTMLSEGIFDEGIHSVHVDARTMTNGVYLYKLETADGAVVTKRMIVIH